MEPCRFAIVSYHRLKDTAPLDRFCDHLLSAGFRLDEEDPELVIVLGGDGSFLRAVHDHDFQGSYLLVNTGHLGFFSDYSLSELRTLHEDILEKEPTYEELPLLSYVSKGEEMFALSDIVLQAEKTIDLSLYLNDRLLCETKTSGIVIGTPVSSTAYLGSLLAPAIPTLRDVFQYILIAPVRNRLYPNAIEKAVLSKDDILEIEVSAGKASLFLDGMKRDEAIEDSFRIHLVKSPTTKLIHFHDNDNFRRILKSVSGIEEE